MGGENTLDYLMNVVAGGSPPRGRGTRAQRRPRQRLLGLIPAWAGKTFSMLSTSSQPEAHPRVGGENARANGVSNVRAGSSPRGRGKRGGSADTSRPPGLIPAWAGKTRSWARQGPARTAHPRVGGENNKVILESVVGGGSSPRGRGKLDGELLTEVDDGLIPAWAGKTRTDAGKSPPSSAHPRVGGENENQTFRQKISTGSSPRGRGKRDDIDNLRPAHRLIPAWAGKTTRCVYSTPKGKAHPRVGGENWLTMRDCTPWAGSSPRGRGKRDNLPHRVRCVRLIPAWAGKTLPEDHPEKWAAAHPRVGGENDVSACSRSARAGSSPRGRGKPRGRRPRARLHGLIPAWAGKT